MMFFEFRTQIVLVLVLSVVLGGCFGSTAGKNSDNNSPKAATSPPDPPPCTPEVGAPDPDIQPASASISFGTTTTLTASGGTAPYRFSVASGPARVNADTGVVTGAGSGISTFVVKDSKCHTSVTSSAVTVGQAPTGTLTPDDPSYTGGLLYGFIKMKLDRGWRIHGTADCRNIIVGVVDTGVDYTHPDLAANMVAGFGKNFGSRSVAPGVTTDDDPKDDNLHGTHVAGTIGAVGNNTTGVVGICWQAKIMALKFLDQDGSGALSDAVSALDYGVAQGVKVFNASWGGAGSSSSLKDAIDRAGSSGAIFITAAGNDGMNIDTSPTYPASFSSSNLIAIAASDSTDHLASFSNFGVNSVALAAPGVSIRSTFPTYMTAEMSAAKPTPYPTNYASISGTSMATPQVSGLAALLWSFDPTLSVSELKTRLKVGVDALPALNGKLSTGGRANSEKVMNPGAS